MLHRRPTAIAALLLAALPATLSACGFDYPTDRVNQIAAGANDREASVDALGIRILSDAEGSGRLIGALANNDNTTAASLDSVTDPSGQVTAGSFAPIEVGGGAGVNLADEETTPIPLTGDLAAGDVVTLELGFSTGEAVTLNVPVVKPCFQYAELAGEAAPEAEAEEGAHSEETDAAHGDETATEEEAAAEEASEGITALEGSAIYDCADEAPAPEEH
ncbi:hypothetical protein E8D34_05860 [Nocardioides sp. GY 10113]|uniref:hypothetical protein n=1 Tax=Nocardioides sp. GY 10113 TaxID=2569761 RepID=UPI0010A7E683|nr:hypothetical protein [Nocardioides sp. GY 10113]TIC88442.1 hypothetical protein E8D34_05860 [Nocardioides sp. GY 10113]